MPILATIDGLHGLICCSILCLGENIGFFDSAAHLFAHSSITNLLLHCEPFSAVSTPMLSSIMVNQETMSTHDIPFGDNAGYSPILQLDIEKSDDEIETPFMQRNLFVHIQSFLLFLLPSFIQNLVLHKQTSRRTHKTSWMDGLRGVAAFIVFIYHTCQADALWLLYGHQTEPSSFIMLPFFRLIYAGSAMVHIFFVISGYVLSVRHIKSIRTGQFEKLGDNIISSIFRRPIRILLPPLVGLCLWDFMQWSGLETRSPRKLLTRIYILAYPWRWSYIDVELSHLWTIPVELAGSFLVFFVIVGLSRAKTWVRMSCVFALILHTGYIGQWALMEFLSGLLLAEIEELLEDIPKASNSFKRLNLSSIGINVLHHTFWICVFIVSLFLLSWPPCGADQVPIYKEIFKYTPTVYFQMRSQIAFQVELALWYGLGAIFMVWAMFRIPILQKPFESGLTQYLGDVSFSLYIWHGFTPIKWQQPIILFSRWITGDPHTAGLALIAIIIEIMGLTVINIVMADLFMRLIDSPSVKLARWIETKARKRD
jgi:peptidoglycan/LPS O-acetylase OafA/YrhL